MRDYGNLMRMGAGTICLILLTLLSTTANARHFKVYGAETLAAGETEIVYWADYVARSDNTMPYFGATVDRDGLWANTLELEYGATDRLTLSGYLDTEQPSGDKFKYVQSRVGGRYRLADAGHDSFAKALYLEYYLPDPKYQGAQELIEVRLLLERQVGWGNLRINPKIEKKTSGPDITEGLEFEYAASLYRPVGTGVDLGLELYGAIGELVNTKPLDQQEHYLVPALNIKLPDGLSWNIGVAVGLTKASDDVVVKSILEWDL